MPKLFDHVGEHHPDQNFIFDQEYGCLAEHLAVACGAIESGFVHDENYSRTQSIARRFFTSIAKSRRRG
jgi:hypothetical protein